MQKAAIYNRWFFRLGGGEKHAFAFAEALRDLGYHTELLTHLWFDKKEAEKKLHVNLSGIDLKIIPNLLDSQLSSYTKEYDIFINNSYLDFIQNRSKKGILSVLFPSPLRTSFITKMKRSVIIPFLRRLFIFPLSISGVHQGNILGPKVQIVFNESFIKEVHLKLSFQLLAFSVLDKIQFLSGEKKIQPQDRFVDVRKNIVTFVFNNLHEARDKGLIILLPHSPYAENIQLQNLTIPGLRNSLYGIFSKIFRSWELRLHGGINNISIPIISSYQHIVVNSEYTKHWVKKYWGVDSEVLYPPIDLVPKSIIKKNWIVNVGRFFRSGHSKKQYEMVNFFRELYDGGKKEWELHFIGTTEEGATHKEYFEKVKTAAQGYPIYFHNNSDYQELGKIVSESKIYWHATGYGEDEETNPEMMEHFGQTTVEAMKAGCVPIVYAKGGQLEIVDKKVGFVWNTKEELIAYTKKIMEDRELLMKMSCESQKKAASYNIETFRNKLQEIIN